MHDNGEFPLALRHLARLLPLRGQRRSYHLFLTSSISLTPDLFRRVCGADDQESFRKYMRELGHNDQINTLSYHLKDYTAGDGHRALASLILQGYFSTILTTSTDSFLEEALIEAGAHPNDMQVLLVGRDQPAYIADVLLNTNRPVTILKLNGSLREHVLPAGFPDVLVYPREIEMLLAQFLAQDLIIVGSLEHELAIQRLLPVLNGNALYSVIPHLSDEGQDHVSRVLEARHCTLSSFIVQGHYGNFHSFFPALFSLLHPGQTTVVEVSNRQDRLPSPVHTRYLIQTEPEKVPQLSAPTDRCDVLLVTATLKEARAVLDMRKNAQRYGFSAGHPYYDLGLVGQARVALMLQSSMGADGLGGARFTISEGIQALHPSAVIMVGIACGLRPDKQRLGDILVSERLAGYEAQRLGTEQDTLELTVCQRNERVAVPPLVLSYVKNGWLSLDFAGWPQAPGVFFGLILSGDKLLDNSAFRETLLRQEPEAIGLEMEGIGLYEAATSAHVNWLLVKAISDWGDGKKAEQNEQFQQIAAENAARFTLEIIAQGGFASQKEQAGREGK